MVRGRQVKRVRSVAVCVCKACVCVAGVVIISLIGGVQLKSRLLPRQCSAFSSFFLSSLPSSLPLRIVE